MKEFIDTCVMGSEYSFIITLIAIILAIIAIYNRIKYLCLEKASELVSTIEGRDDLTGEEKFAVVVKWISEDFPKVFRNSLIISIIEKIVQFAYENCYTYMRRYIKRKTGYDITGLIDEVQSAKSSACKES